MKIYNYSKQNGEFLMESEARLDPLEAKVGKEVYLMPKCSTKTEPPKVRKNEAAAFLDGQWTVVPDWRKTVYYIGSDAVLIKDIGIEPPAGTTTNPPPKGFKIPFFDGYNWIDQLPEPEQPPENYIKLTPTVVNELIKVKTFEEFLGKLKELSDI